VKTAGQLGSTEELKVASELFQRNVIAPYQLLINETISTLLRESGIYTSAKATSEPLMLSSELTEELEAQLLEYLESVGEKIGDEWELISEQEVEDEKNEYKIHLEKQKFFKRFADPDAKSSNDTGLYKIRYRYSQNLKDNSRLFCRNMVSNSKGGVVYRFEDIQSMDGQVNTEFSPKGSNSYSIWEWKGGVYCHHRWVRQVYFRKRENGKFLPNKGLANDTRIPESQAIKADVPMKDEGKNWAQASTAPINTPSRGKLN